MSQVYLGKVSLYREWSFHPLVLLSGLVS